MILYGNDLASSGGADGVEVKMMTTKCVGRVIRISLQ